MNSPSGTRVLNEHASVLNVVDVTDFASRSLFVGFKLLNSTLTLEGGRERWRVASAGQRRSSAVAQGTIGDCSLREHPYRAPSEVKERT